jgi:hypothetical protein
MLRQNESPSSGATGRLVRMVPFCKLNLPSGKEDMFLCAHLALPPESITTS